MLIGYFNNINHDKLMLMVKQRYPTKNTQNDMEITAGVMEDGKYMRVN